MAYDEGPRDLRDTRGRRGLERYKSRRARTERRNPVAGDPNDGLNRFLQRMLYGEEASPIMDADQYAALFRNLNSGSTDALTSMLFGSSGQPGALAGLFGKATTQSPYTSAGAGMMSGAAGGIGDLLQQIYGAAGSYDPNAYFSQFLSQAPQLQGLAMGSIGTMGEDLKKQTADQVRSAVGVAGNEMAGMGGLYSSAFMDRAAGESARAGRDAALTLGQSQLGIYNNLLGQGMGLASGNQQFGLSSLLSGFGMGLEGLGTVGNLGGALGNLGLGQQGLYGSLWGQGLGAAAGLANPEWVAPQLNPGSEGLADMNFADLMALIASFSKMAV